MEKLNSRDVFIDTLKLEVNPTSISGGKIVGASTSNTELIGLYENILSGQQKLGDMQIHSIVPWTNTVEFFKQDDAISIGIINLDRAQLPNGKFFLPLEVQILIADLGAAFTATTARNGDYKSIGEVAAFAPAKNAEWHMKHNESFITPEGNTAQVFVTNESHEQGIYKLDTPRIFENQKRIEFVFKTMGTIPANHAIKLILRGCGTLPR